MSDIISAQINQAEMVQFSKVILLCLAIHLSLLFLWLWTSAVSKRHKMSVGRAGSLVSRMWLKNQIGSAKNLRLLDATWTPLKSGHGDYVR